MKGVLITIVTLGVILTGLYMALVVMFNESVVTWLLTGRVFLVVISCVSGVVLPLWLLVHAIGRVSERAQERYRENHIKDMTEEQIEAYDNRAPFALRHPGTLSLGVILLIIATIPVSWPFVLIIIARSLYLRGEAKKELRAWNEDVERKKTLR